MRLRYRENMTSGVHTYVAAGWSIRIGHYVFVFQPGGSSDA